MNGLRSPGGLAGAYVGTLAGATIALLAGLDAAVVTAMASAGAVGGYVVGSCADQRSC